MGRWIGVALLLLVLAPRPAEAWIGGLLRGAAKVASKGVGKGAGALGKGAGSVGKLGKGAVGAGVAMSTADDVGRLLVRSVPDEPGRLAVYADLEGGNVTLMGRSGALGEAEAAGWSAVDDLRTAERPAVDLYLDPDLAHAPPKLAPGDRLYVVEGSGKARPMRQDADGQWVQDAADVALDVADYAVDLEGEGDTGGGPPTGPAKDALLVYGLAAIGAAGFGAYMWRERRKERERQRAREADGE